VRLASHLRLQVEEAAADSTGIATRLVLGAIARRLGFRRLARRPLDSPIARNAFSNSSFAMLLALLAADRPRNRQQHRGRPTAKQMLRHRRPYRGGSSLKSLQAPARKTHYDRRKMTMQRATQALNCTRVRTACTKVVRAFRPRSKRPATLGKRVNSAEPQVLFGWPGKAASPRERPALCKKRRLRRGHD
jgi:hypothetical protein